MAALQNSVRADQELSEMRQHYNILCSAMSTASVAQANSADRLLADLQRLATEIADSKAWQDAAIASLAAKSSPVTPPEPALPRPTRRIHAFRTTLPGRAADDNRIGGNGLRPTAKSLSAQLADQAAAIERLARDRTTLQPMWLRLERRRLAGANVDAMADVAPIREAIERQDVQMIALAESVRDLARRLASGGAGQGKNHPAEAG